MKLYPSSVSRTLDPEGRSLTTVIGRHDRRITDADINLIQDVQDLKRRKVLNDTTFSGCLTLNPFVFNSISDYLLIPAFDVLFNGEVVTIGGAKTSDASFNRVQVPPPVYWANGLVSPEASIYVVYLEMWYKTLNTETGEGYYVDPSGNKYFYANGNIDCDARNLIPDDVVDPFQQLVTTFRAQIQWALRAAPLPLTYDFSKYRAGLDQGSGAGERVLGRAAASSASSFAFQNLGSINGDYGLWRCGDGNALNDLSTMDGYSYAMPVAVIFQRNTGTFDPSSNPFGCASSGVSRSGLLTSGISGRFDSKFADVIYPDDLVDTRSTVSLTGYDMGAMMDQSFVDVISGITQFKIARGEAPGSKPIALGSKLHYTVQVSSKSVPNVDPLGSFDGYANGFSSDARTFLATKTLTIKDKVIGTKNIRWMNGDAVVLQLGTNVLSSAKFSSVMVQALVKNATTGQSEPVVLFGGQIGIEGLQSRQITIKFTQDLRGTAYDPGTSPLILTVGVSYAAGGMDLKKIPSNVDGGILADPAAGTNLPVYGVSEFDTTREVVLSRSQRLTSYNPNYSGITFGSRITFTAANSTATTRLLPNGTTINTFTIPASSVHPSLHAQYAISAADITSGAKLHISNRGVYQDQLIVEIDGVLSQYSSTKFSFMLKSTAQLSYVAAVKGVLSIEETVLIGNSSSAYTLMDPRVVFAGYKKTDTDSTLFFYAKECTIKGVAGDDEERLLWIQDSTGKFNAYPCEIQIFGGVLSVRVVGTLDISSVKFFLVASILPAFASTASLTLQTTYIPYQGEGIENRPYNVLFSSNEAVVTTNGTGTAPVAGVKDVFPFNRDLPVVTTLPSQPTWLDSELTNQPMSAEFDANYYSKRFQNTEHTFRTPLHTNDFIEPVHGFKRKIVRLSQKAGGRGFSKAYPHIGYAVNKPRAKNVLGDNLQTTIAPVILYVNNVTGSNDYDGFTKLTPKKTIQAALSLLPPIIRHPVSIVLLDTGRAYSVKDFSAIDFSVALIGDGETRSLRYYCLGNIAFVMQDQARLTIGRETGSTARIEINSQDFAGFGDGIMSAFFISDSRVILSGMKFTGFTNHAVKVIDGDVELLDCEFDSNLLGISAEQGSTITINKGQFTLGDSGTGAVLTDSSLVVSSVTLKVATGKTPNIFFVGERTSNLSMYKHDVQVLPAVEVNISASTIIASLQAGSTLICDPSWVSKGKAKFATNSVLSRSISKTPFLGGIDSDASSSVVTNL